MIVLMLFSALAWSAQCGPKNTELQTLREIQKHIEKQKPKSAPKKLAPAIIRAANKYRIDARLLSSILAVESKYRLEARSKTGDWGIAQVNEVNFDALKIQKHRLITDLEYSVDVGASRLAWFLNKYRDTGLCRYNVGTGKLIGQRLKNCIKYRNKVRKIYYSGMTAKEQR